MRATRPLRVLHVMHGLNRGGIESWLVQVLRHTDRAAIEMDFAVSAPGPYDYDALVASHGAAVFPCQRPAGTRLSRWLPLAAGARKVATYTRGLRHVLRQLGPYDVVHSHFDPCGFPLWLAERAGVRVRVAHSHAAVHQLSEAGRLKRALFLPLAEYWVRRHATAGLAASREAAVTMFGPAWQRDPRWRVLHYGVDLTGFRDRDAGRGARRELDIPEEAFVIGHVGRLHWQKNHGFLLRVAAEVLRREPRTRLLLVGEGPLRDTIAEQAARLGLADRVIFAGVRADVARLMLGAMDVFVLPSLFEGLPLVGIEAQAAGLPCVVSDAITPELDVVPGAVHRMSLASPPGAWAEAILKRGQEAPALTPAEALAAVCDSSLSIERSAAALAAFYRECACAGAPGASVI